MTPRTQKDGVIELLTRGWMGAGSPVGLDFEMRLQTAFRDFNGTDYITLESRVRRCLALKYAPRPGVQGPYFQGEQRELLELILAETVL